MSVSVPFWTDAFRGEVKELFVWFSRIVSTVVDVLTTCVPPSVRTPSPRCERVIGARRIARGVAVCPLSYYLVLTLQAESHG
eukprot:2562066-Amphidinium_carterae.1